MVHTWARRFFHSKDGETKFDPKFNTNDVTVVSVSLIGCWSVRIFTRSKNNQSETRRYMVLLGPVISCVCPFYFALSMSPLLKTKPSRLQACYGVLTNTEVREVMDGRQFHGTCAAMFVVDWKDLQLNRQVWSLLLGPCLGRHVMLLTKRCVTIEITTPKK